MTDSAESLLREAHEYLRLVEDGYSSVMDTQNNLLHRIDAHLASNPAGEAREIAECPWCGSFPEVRPWHGGGPNKHLVSCVDEGCAVNPKVTGSTRKKAIKLWCTRVILVSRSAPAQPAAVAMVPVVDEFYCQVRGCSEQCDNCAEEDPQKLDLRQISIDAGAITRIIEFLEPAIDDADTHIEASSLEHYLKARLNAAPPTSRLEGQRESDVKASCNDRPDDCRALAEKPDSHPTPEQNAAQAWAVFGLDGNILLYTISAYENQAWSRTGHRTGSTCRRVLITEAPAHD